MKNFNGETGGCGAWAIGLYNYYKNLGYNPVIKELNKGIHYWVEVEECSLDWHNFVKKQICPDISFTLGRNNKIIDIPHYKMFTIISKRVAYGNLYIEDFFKIGEKIAKQYKLKNQKRG